MRSEYSVSGPQRLQLQVQGPTCWAWGAFGDFTAMLTHTRYAETSRTTPDAISATAATPPRCATRLGPSTALKLQWTVSATRSGADLSHVGLLSIHRSTRCSEPGRDACNSSTSPVLVAFAPVWMFGSLLAELARPAPSRCSSLTPPSPPRWTTEAAAKIFPLRRRSDPARRHTASPVTQRAPPRGFLQPKCAQEERLAAQGLLGPVGVHRRRQPPRTERRRRRAQARADTPGWLARGRKWQDPCWRARDESAEPTLPTPAGPIACAGGFANVHAFIRHRPSKRPALAGAGRHRPQPLPLPGGARQRKNGVRLRGEQGHRAGRHC